MGKNQQWKDTQRSRHSTTDGAPTAEVGDGMVDASFHTPEWHAARVAALQVERLSWEDWKKRQKEEEERQNEIADAEERRMREYRAQLEADRAARMGHAATGEGTRKDKKRKKRSSSKERKDSKDKKKKKKKSKSKSKKGKDKQKSRSKKRRKKNGSDGSSSDSDHGGSSSSSSSSSSDDEGGGRSDGPIRLSEYLKG